MDPRPHFGSVVPDSTPADLDLLHSSQAPFRKGNGLVDPPEYPRSWQSADGGESRTRHPVGPGRLIITLCSASCWLGWRKSLLLQQAEVGQNFPLRLRIRRSWIAWRLLDLPQKPEGERSNSATLRRPTQLANEERRKDKILL